jgi:hypothetical protein
MPQQMAIIRLLGGVKGLQRYRILTVRGFLTSRLRRKTKIRLMEVINHSLNHGLSLVLKIMKLLREEIHT